MTCLYNWEKVEYKNDRGLKLAGLLYTGKKPDTVVVICHGFTGSKEGGGKGVAMAEELGKRGYASLLFDFSGCGESEGDFADISLTSHIGDIKSSVDFCIGLGFNRVITIGRSFGGTAALCHGGVDDRVAGVSAWAAPAYPARLFSGFLEKATETENDLIPLSGQEGTVFVKKSFFQDLNSHDVTGKASMISPRPLLIVHGSSDIVVPVRNAEDIFKSAGEPKEIRIISGADHQFTGHYQEVWKSFFDWLEAYLPF